MLRSGLRVAWIAAYSVLVLPDPVGPVIRIRPCGESSAARRGPAGRAPSRLLERRDVLAAGEQPDDDLLAVQAGQRRDPGVERLAVEGEPGPAVLRLALLGDVEPGDDLDAAGDSRGRGTRDRHDVAQDAVDAEPDPKRVGLRLDVDVGGAAGRSIFEDDVDQPHDRRGGRGLVGVGLGRQRGGDRLGVEERGDSLLSARVQARRSCSCSWVLVAMTTRRLPAPVWNRTSSRASRLVGSLTATVICLPFCCRTSTPSRSAMSRGTRRAASGDIGVRERSTSSKPRARARACATCASVANPMSTMTEPTRRRGWPLGVAPARRARGRAVPAR